MIPPLQSTDSAAQFHAVSSAWIPFILALLAVGAGMWLLVRWAYVPQLHKAKKYRQRADNDIKRFKSQTNELKKENKKKGYKIAELENEKARLSEAGQKALAELADSTEETGQTLEELGDTSDALDTSLDAGSAELLGKDAEALARK
jgi:DNA anti-recombination protein RmuC